ncbi:MAG: ribosome silencing factor [Gemmatimonadales bacterium]|jgi:ribosome-associated protein|nr:MAG: ribosome silencing factor [Gemmatimonadales bacterium]
MEPVTSPSLDELPDPVVRAGQLALERKAQDVVLLDLRGISSATDHFVIASGTSDIQVKAIADHILEDLRKEGQKPAHVEGLETARWVLMDYIDFVVHVFHPQARDFYQLEALWGDAPRLEMTEEAPAP